MTYLGRGVLSEQQRTNRILSPSGMGKVILFQIITEMSERANALNIRTRELCEEKDIHQQDWNREETNLW